jgi:hypothetical protein
LTESIEPFRCSPEDTIEQENAGNGEGDVKHSFYEQRKFTMSLLFQIDARTEGHQKDNDEHPYGLTVNRAFLLDILSHVDADEEDGNPTPEDFQVTYGLVDGDYPLHHDAPNDGYQRCPPIERVLDDEFHVEWRNGIEHHDGWYVPEMQFAIEPEIPIDEDVSQ